MTVNIPFEQEIFTIAESLYGPIIKQAELTHLVGLLNGETSCGVITKTEGEIELVCAYPEEHYDPDYWMPNMEWTEVFIKFEFEGLMGNNPYLQENPPITLVYKDKQVTDWGSREDLMVYTTEDIPQIRRLLVDNGLIYVSKLSSDTSVVFKSITEKYAALITISLTNFGNIRAEIKLEE